MSNSTTTVRPATDRQLNYISSLLSKVELTEEQRADAEDRINRSYLYNEAHYDDRTGRMVSTGGITRHVVLTAQGASEWIDRLVEMKEEQEIERAARPVVAVRESRSNPEPEAGMYKVGDDIVRVYLGQKSGRMLAKKLVTEGEMMLTPDGITSEKIKASYEYMGAASRFVSPTTPKLSLEEAKAFGRMTGTCCVCARRLDDPESVDAGIGPVCGKRVG